MKQKGEIEIEDFRPIVPKSLEENLINIFHAKLGLHLGARISPVEWCTPETTNSRMKKTCSRACSEFPNDV